jgi:hypothetical protein
MRSLRQVFGRGENSAESDAAAKSWNTLSTIGVGSVADVDARGVVYPRGRPLSIEVWFGFGDRWVRGSADAGVRQTRVVGLPIIETRQRVGEDDLVQTAWADESGDGRGRVVVELRNEADVAVVAAIVVRPRTLLVEGSITDLRVADTLIVADRRPLIELSRRPGDVAAAVDVDDALLDLLRQSSVSLVAHTDIHDDEGRASLAAMIPLTPGIERQIQILDGREAATVAPAPLDRVVAGWRSHLENGAEFDLPGWPKHLPTALMSSLIGAVADEQGPLGAESWKIDDDAGLATALGGVGLDWAASSVVDRLLDGVADGTIRRSHWVGVAAACASIVGSSVGDETLARHADSVVSVAGEVLTKTSTPWLPGRLVEVVRVAHGTKAADDASSIVASKTTVGVVPLARLGVPVGKDNCSEVVKEIKGATRPLSVFDVALSMVASSQCGQVFDGVVPVRALAGSSWRWGHDGCGDSPHARAAILGGLRSLVLGEDDDTIDLVPGFHASWLGQNVRVARIPTRVGMCSFAIRWHGARPALLWEFDRQPTAPFTLMCRTLDPTFRSGDAAGEALLEEPSHLVGA